MLRAGKGYLVQLAAGAIAVMLMSALVFAQDNIDPERYAHVKAGFLLNFVRYTEWPAESFDDADAPIVVTIVGEDRMTPEFERLVLDERIRDRQIELRTLEHPKPLWPSHTIDADELRQFHERLLESHVVFFAATEGDRFKMALDALEEKNILTVSDIEDFGVEGGMLGLAVKGGRVVFDANAGEIEKTKLRVSSKLLRLANVVETRKDRQ